MLTSKMFNFIPLLAIALLLSGAIAIAENNTSTAAIPDLTNSIDFERKGEYYLGPTGAKGWMHVNKSRMTTDARQILITKVEPNSAADGVLEVGDVIVGIGDKLFDTDARKALGQAIDQAEQNDNHGILKLLRWRSTKDASPRQGKESTVELKLKVMGTYSDTAPWNCPKTERILEDAINVIVKRNQMGRLGDTALALLSTGQPEHLKIVRDYLHNEKWAKPDYKISLEAGGLVVWSYGYHNLLLTEYFLASGDEYVLPAIKEHAVKLSMGQSNGGTWGHGFAWTNINDGQIHGSLPGYGAVNQAGLPCYLSLLLAKKCGIEHSEIDAAISRSSRFFQQFVDNGSIGYGYHRPSLEINANGGNGMSGNGKNGIAAVAFRLEGNPEATRFFSKLTASLYNTCEYGHSGNSYSYFWDPLGANCGGLELASAFLKEMRWYYALTRQADGSFVNQPLGGYYGRKLLDPTAAQVLIATFPRKAIYLTGKGQKESDSLGKEDAQAAIATGRWRLANTDEVSADELIAKLDNWSPIAREWVAKKLANKEGEFVPQLLQQLESDSPEARAGACAVLGHLRERAAEAVPQLAEALSDEEPIVSIAAGYAVARIGKPAQQAIPQLLRALFTSEEPERMKPKQQALAYSLGHARARTAPLYFSGILPTIAEDNNPLDGLDRELLYPTITKLLHDPSGRTRGCGTYAFQFFSREDTAAMAQEIYDVVKNRATNYLMFDDNSRKDGLNLMARFRIKEGLPLCFETFRFNRWGAGKRFPARFETLQAYGGGAKEFLPNLREMRSQITKGEQRDMLEKTIKLIEEAEPQPPLISLHDLVDERFAKDLSEFGFAGQPISLCRQLMKRNPHDFFYQAAGLRKIVEIYKAKAFDDLLLAVSHRNEILHAAAVSLATELPGSSMTDKWSDQLATAEGKQLAGILDVLASRKDTRALPKVKKYLDHKDESVRTAATRAVEALD